MKKKNIIAIAIAALVIVVLVIFADRIIERKGADLHTGYGRVQDIQGFVEDCGAHRFVAGRGGSARSQGTAALHHIYPELNAKLIQAEAVRSAAEAMNKKADKGARKPQLEAAKSMWQKADAGLTLAQKTYDRAKALYDKGSFRVRSSTRRRRISTLCVLRPRQLVRSTIWPSTVQRARREGCHGGSGATGTGARWTRWSRI